jgi:uncharacterized protein (TIGR02231 family)
MRLAFAFAVLATTAITPAFAADILAKSHVDAVTVFPSGAEVTRAADADLPAGDTTLVFADLPGEADSATLRVEGISEGGVQIGSVDSKVEPVMAANGDEARKKLNDKITALQDERGQLDQQIADADYQKTLMQQLAGNAFQPAKDGAKSFGAQDVGAMLDLVGAKLQVLSKTMTDARLRQRDIDKEIDDLNKALALLAPSGEQRMTVAVHLESKAVAHGTFRLKYRVADAGWHPIYDARLTSPAKDTKAGIELVRRAEVQQATTERWDGVELTLSTARPLGATAAPDLESYLLIDRRADLGGAANADMDEAAKQSVAGQLKSMTVDAAAPANKPASLEFKKDKVEQVQAQIEVAGFQALYNIPGRVSIDNSGMAKKVRIDTSNFDATLTARAVPKLDPNAYLTASFTLAGDTPLLPGPVVLYRDGVFMGQGALPLLSPGEEAKLGFGADDLIKVKRVEVKNLSGEEGILTTSKVESHAWDITVKNLHDVAMPITIIDQVPYSTLEDVTVETLPAMTPPTVTDLDKKRGILAWTISPDPKAETVIHHGFKITAPKDKVVGMN